MGILRQRPVGEGKNDPLTLEFLAATSVIEDRLIREKQKFINMYTSWVHRRYSWENEISRVAYNVGLITSSVQTKKKVRMGRPVVEDYHENHDERGLLRRYKLVPSPSLVIFCDLEPSFFSWNRGDILANEEFLCSILCNSLNGKRIWKCFLFCVVILKFSMYLLYK